MMFLRLIPTTHPLRLSTKICIRY